MSQSTVRTVLGRLGRTQIRHVAAIPPRRATPLVGRVYGEVEDEFGVLAPPVALHSPAIGPLAASWLMLRETIVVTGKVDRASKEAVSAAVSRANACPFCATIHSATLDILVQQNRRAGVAVPAELDGLTEWAAASPRALGPLPFPVEQAPELIGTVVLLHYLNRMVSVFLGELPLPPGVPRVALGPVLRVLRHQIQRAARIDHAPGQSLDLLPPAPLPRQLRWAEGNATVAHAFARAAAAFDVAGVRAAPPRVHRLLEAELRAWSGQPRGLSRAWVTDYTRDLPAAERPIARLALLTAFAPHQVDTAVVEACQLDDRTLIELTSWASMAAARQIGERVWLAAEKPRPADHTRIDIR